MNSIPHATPSKKNMNSIPLSHDLIMEILLRLPIKSLIRFKCVCKSWFSLISDPCFVKSHLAAAPTDQILLKFDYSIYPNPSSMPIWGIKFFSSKTNLGKKVEGHFGYILTPPGAFLNGAFHWLALSNNKKHFHVIIAYDWRERSLSEISLPHDLTMEIRSKIFCLTLTTINGCLCVCYDWGDDERAEVWMMEEYKLQSSWNKFLFGEASL